MSLAKISISQPRERRVLEQQDRQGVGLLPRGTAGAPDPQPAARAVPLHDLGDDLLGERAQLVHLAEEVGLVGRQHVDDLRQLLLALGAVEQQVVVVEERAELPLAQAMLQPPLEKIRRVVVEPEAAEPVDEVPQEPELLGPERHRLFAGAEHGT